MKRPRSRPPSPALVVACLALFVALGGTVLAARRPARKINGHAIRVKSMPGNRLALGSVPGNRLRRGTIPGDRIAPGSLTGAQIQVGTLAQVPSAAHADAADTARHAGTAIAAEHAADATTVNGHAVGCPTGRQQFAGACWDLAPSATAVTALEAAAACAAEGGELPDTISLTAFGGQPGARLSLDGEWTSEISTVTTTSYDVLLFLASGEIHPVQPTQLHHFRCVTPFLS